MPVLTCSTRFAGHRIRVAVADEHPLLLFGLVEDLRQRADICVVGSATNSATLMELLKRHAVVSVYAMAGGAHGDGLMLFDLLRKRYPHIKLIALTSINHADTVRALLAVGAHGVVNKADAMDHVVAALHAACSGERYLSPRTAAVIHRPAAATRVLSARELEVVRMFVSGLTITEIAERLRRSKQTVSAQKRSAMRKLGLLNDADLIRYGMDGELAALGYNTLRETPPVYLDLRCCA